MKHLIRKATLHGQSDTGKRMAQMAAIIADNGLSIFFCILLITLVFKEQKGYTGIKSTDHQ